LKRHREERGYSIQKLADILGISRTTVYRYEDDEVKTNVTTDKVADIAYVLNIPREEVLDALKADGVSDFKIQEFNKKYLMLTGSSERKSGDIISDYTDVESLKTEITNKTADIRKKVDSGEVSKNQMLLILKVLEMSDYQVDKSIRVLNEVFRNRGVR